MDENMEGEGGELKGTETILKLRKECHFDGVIIGTFDEAHSKNNVNHINNQNGVNVNQNDIEDDDGSIQGEQLRSGANLSWSKPLASDNVLVEDLEYILNEQAFSYHDNNSDDDDDDDESSEEEESNHDLDSNVNGNVRNIRKVDFVYDSSHFDHQISPSCAPPNSSFSNFVNLDGSS
eukprot:CAMPEP_0114341550 /NCGR_PEP_ID=MMETSP0101-20121206/9122_1 /TAXON_ID=38822 ORGANISM="Pteridomonas danica, Strain PT" /NCGR_SAMPLE_ID=MMETSP0101 /ASSEMBLY_ACC=CAM_ASM_000211 /LENGTH=177 /DNA_ID=CAMNT_0001475191 /DNA_START=1354 /DNA_END=1887 /DNA_ORIENTATION=-